AVVQWLLKEGGASIKEMEKSGNTALLLAASNGHLAMVQWLLQKGGASVQEVNKNITTALQRTIIYEEAFILVPEDKMIQSNYNKAKKQLSEEDLKKLISFKVKLKKNERE